jgi:hypothetical protein
MINSLLSTLHKFPIYRQVHLKVTPNTVVKLNPHSNIYGCIFSSFFSIFHSAKVKQKTAAATYFYHLESGHKFFLGHKVRGMATFITSAQPHFFVHFLPKKNKN